ncbi:hypothetical protein DAPPUDRAFT_220795 [Daphnia pulex]|uniref:Uncharacterized protein n=1 Tax=Daphnia pulex TaxID=6669 RepID=E9FVT9_DAPPU|nr:hypothetical protein DAPPUDRAFT_220795 [Daphnia pulex]|eukprot:EFX88610.1 hypothetical protein DAPPUDRAFT_220795 [Daphnia pulex]
MQQSNDYVDDPLVAYKAGLAAALSCLLTAEEGERIGGSDSGAAAAAPGVVELLASTLRLHLRKQQAFNEYYSIQKQITSARLVTVNSRDNDDLQTTLTTTNTAAAIQTVTDDDEDSIRRRQLLMECFQGVNLHYNSSSVHQTIAPPSSPEPNTNQVGPSL